MLSLTTPLDAYRADAREHAARPSLTADDAALLRLGTMLHRLAQTSDAGATAHLRAEAARAAKDILHAAGVPASDTLAGAVRAIGSMTEDAGALRLANVLLHLAYLSAQETEGSIERGRIIAQRARVARKAGEHEQARMLYEETRLLGDEEDIDELRARAQLGFALLARSRGNIPEAEGHLRAALEPASRGAPDVAAMVHHELMVIAAGRQRFDEAVVHAWSAFRDIEGDAVREADALLNVGQAILDAGRPHVALRAFCAALSRPLPKRLALPALGGAARAAARLRDERLVRRFVKDIDLHATGADVPHAVVDALREAAEALHPFAPEEAAQRRAIAHAEAVRQGFHELEFRLEQPLEETQPRPMEVGANSDAARVLAEVETLAVSAAFAGV